MVNKASCLIRIQTSPQHIVFIHLLTKCYFIVVRENYRQTTTAMPNWNSVKRQLKFDKPRYLFTKTHKPKTKTHLF